MNRPSSPTAIEGAVPPSPAIRVVLVDDHRIVREGVRRILEAAADIVIVGEAEDGHGALALIRRTAPAVAVLDLNLTGVSGMNLVRRVKQDHPRTAVLVLSMHGEQQYAMRALKAGAQGYLTKDSASEELLTAVRKVAQGGCHLSRGMAERVAMLLAHEGEGPRHELLSDREFDVFRLIVAGHRITDIARALHLSIKTVSTHKSRLLQKLQLDGTAALVRYGMQHRLFSDSEAQEGATGDSEHQPTAMRHRSATPARRPAGSSVAKVSDGFVQAVMEF